MANIKGKGKLYHEELKEQGEKAEVQDILPEYDIEEDKKESVVNVEEDKRAERFAEWAATSHLDKCKLRACKEFDVTLEQLSKVVRDLNGRKIDGVYINDIIGRYGFYNGNQLNRAALAEKYSRSVEEIQFVHDKVKAIVQHKDFVSAYGDYVEGVKKETVQEIDNIKKVGE